MNNLHISLTNFCNESRVLKEVNTLIDNQIFDTVFIAALYEEGVDKQFDYSEKVKLNRFLLRTRQLPKTFLFQVMKYVEFCFKVFLHYRNSDIKVVNIHSLGLLPLGIFLKKVYGAKLVYDTHELETEKNGLYGFKKKVAKFVEKKFINCVDMTLVVSNSIADWYSNEYDIVRPTVVLNTPRCRQIEPKNIFRQHLDIREDQTIMLYQGVLDNGRGIQLIIDAFKERDDDNLVIVFMGYGSLVSEIKIASKIKKNIYYFPAVPPEIVLEYTASADIGISLIENVCLSYYYCMPNKLFEYAMVGLPVLVSNMKDMSSLVIKNSMGVVINDFSAKSINDSINIFLTKDLNDMKINAYRVAIENSWEVQEFKMLRSYKELFNK